MTLQQGFPAALSPARSIPASANRKRLRSTSRVFQSTRGAFGSRDLLSRNPVARIKARPLHSAPVIAAARRATSRAS